LCSLFEQLPYLVVKRPSLRKCRARALYKMQAAACVLPIMCFTVLVKGGLFVCSRLPFDEAQKFHIIEGHYQHVEVRHLVERFLRSRFHMIFLVLPDPIVLLSDQFLIVCDRQHQISAFAATHLERRKVLSAKSSPAGLFISTASMCDTPQAPHSKV
jgi:hypothetical protein